jgi:hypothetical protein
MADKEKKVKTFSSICIPTELMSRVKAHCKKNKMRSIHFMAYAAERMLEQGTVVQYKKVVVQEKIVKKELEISKGV